MSKIGEDLIKGMENAIAHIEGRKPARHIYTIRGAKRAVRIEHAPSPQSGEGAR